ncbi:MAG: septum formation protein Maf [Chlorobi bacterium]|nr:septum formation protein Maf [Chlorobiota bacterium]
MKWVSKYPIVLASSSPRRIQLLKLLDVDFKVFSIPVNELEQHPEGPEKLVIHNATLKGETVKKQYPDHLIIAADTTVWLGDKALQKPKSPEEAFQFLKTLSGRTHIVYSGVYIASPERTETFIDTTEVSFHNLTDEEINYYIEKYKPFDKAGSYGAQDWAGLVFIKEIKGDFYNVMGLPVSQLWRKLRKYLHLKK